jgi:hypothetical protein
MGAKHTNGATNDNDGSLATAQMSMKKGLKMFGEGGVVAVRGEMQQLHDRKVMEPRHTRDLTPEELREALGYLMFLKRKRCGKIKGHGCADGCKQRPHIDRANAASPTVATESVFLMAVIDALENRDIAIVDIPGAFMQVDLDDETIHVRQLEKWLSCYLRSIEKCMNHTSFVKKASWYYMYSY